MNYIEAHKLAQQLLEAGEIKSFCTGHSRERGRYIQVETEQGWNPHYLFEDYPAEQGEGSYL